MNRIDILHAGGGGCHWLSHTIYCLQTTERNIIPVRGGEKFDDGTTLKGYELTCNHWAYELNHTNYYILSTKYMFNICIAGHEKNIHILDDLTMQEKFERHTNNALHQMSDDHIYAKPDLDHNWIYNYPDRFIDVLFNILDKHEFDYEADREFMHASILNYIKSNPLPNKYYDNYKSLMWLGWCHAVVMNSDEDVQTNLIECSTVQELANALYPFRELCLTKVKEFIIPGTLNG